MKESVSPMAYLTLAGFASTAVLAVSALYNVAAQGAYNPNLPVKQVTALASTASPSPSQTSIVAKATSQTPTKVVAPLPTTPSKDPAPAPPAEQAEIAKKVASLTASVKNIDYERARFHKLHFKPAITTASNAQCLVCHREILTRKPVSQSPAGVKAVHSLAWYQTLDTYSGAQQTFHYRHLESKYAKQVMNLSCTFCHKGNDPREENPDMQRGQKVFTTSAKPNFTLRKMVNPATTCLRCHGKFPFENMDGVEANWPVARKDIEDEDIPNGCVSCHGEGGFRPNRHNVTYLNAGTIEKLAEKSSDVCFGCHGGRKWYRTNYPYPRHAWPDMDTDETPDWAKNRPTQSDPQYQRKPAK